MGETEQYNHFETAQADHEINEMNEMKQEESEEHLPDDLLEQDEIIEELSKGEVEKSLRDTIHVMTQEVEGLSDKMDKMNQLFLNKIMHTEHEEKIVDKMHKELQHYKEDLYAQLVRPILVDIIEVRDSILRMANVYKEKPEGQQDIPHKLFADYALDIQDILEKNEIEVYQSSLGDAFVPVKQRAIKKLPTDNEELHGKIAQTMSSGYTYKGKTISAEKVNVYYYEKPNQADIPKEDNE